LEKNAIKAPQKFSPSVKVSKKPEVYTDFKIVEKTAKNLPTKK
jgi:hypothetical protein